MEAGAAGDDLGRVDSGFGGGRGGEGGESQGGENDEEVGLHFEVAVGTWDDLRLSCGGVEC